MSYLLEVQALVQRGEVSPNCRILLLTQPQSGPWDGPEASYSSHFTSVFAYRPYKQGYLSSSTNR